jgi:pimeloyl-ACP methyl ester carboxylesterase
VEAEAEPPVPIVFLHHFGGSARTWDGVIGHLRAEHRCAAPDLAGFGAAHEAPGPFTVARYADDLANLVERLGSEPYVVVGHSMGGKVALAFGARRPAGLAALVLLAPSPPTPEPMTDEDRAATLAGHGDRNVALATLAKITARPLSATMAERTVDDMLRSSPEAWAAWLESGSREDISAEVDGLPAPTLVAVGDEDSIMPADVQRTETLPRLRIGRLVTVTGAGHLLPLEADRAVADLIRGVCQKVERRLIEP